MKVGDVMTSEVKTIGDAAPLKEAATVMVNAGISGLPVVDDDRRVIGIITEADFVNAEASRSWRKPRRRLLSNFLGEAETHQAKTVGDVMSADPYTIDRESTVTEAARKMTDLRVKRLPVVTPDGALEGIISRADVMGAFAREDDQLRDEIVNDILVGVMQLDPDHVTVVVEDGVVTLDGSVPTRTDGRLLEELTVRVEGVISVEASLAWTHDNTRPGSGAAGLR